jgi:hypothetical protein
MNHNMLVFIVLGEAGLELGEPGLEIKFVVWVRGFAAPICVSFEVEDAEILHVACCTEDSWGGRLGETG